MGRILGFLRVSTEGQELNNQKLEILEWAQKHGLRVEEFVQHKMSTRKRKLEEVLADLLVSVKPGDTVVVAELSRFSRSLGQLVGVIKALTDNGVRLVSLKEGLDIDAGNKNDIHTTITVGLFSMLYDIERSMISARTKAGLAHAKSKGKKIGRPKGKTGKSKLDGYADAIQRLRDAHVSYAAIGRMFGCHRGTVKAFVENKLEKS
jgi:DNA invertase Pin-like site-specific DNA recombinase